MTGRVTACGPSLAVGGSRMAAGVTMGHLSAQTHTSTQPPPGAGEIPDTELVLVVGGQQGCGDGVGRIPSRDQCDHTPADCDGPSHVMCRYCRLYIILSVSVL